MTASICPDKSGMLQLFAVEEEGSTTRSVSFFTCNGKASTLLNKLVPYFSL